jgi:hypothetical protein
MHEIGLQLLVMGYSDELQGIVRGICLCQERSLFLLGILSDKSYIRESSLYPYIR